MTDMNQLVEILLATYNSEKYIRQQIDSILNQSYRNIRILIHDDGSTDATISLIKEYQRNFPENVVFIDDGVKTGGAVWNFEHLLKYSSADYVMFSDHDDVWLPNKVEVSLKEILSVEQKFSKKTPVLVYTDVIVVDEDLNKISDSLWRYIKVNGSKISVGRALETSLGLGCTMIINKSLRDLALPFPKTAIIHDMWLSLVAVCLGVVKYLDLQTVLYRQHSSNLSGAERQTLLDIVKSMFKLSKIKKFREDYYKKRAQAIDFYNMFRNRLSKDSSKVIDTYINLPNYNPIVRMYKVFSSGIFWTGNVRDLGRLVFRWVFL